MTVGSPSHSRVALVTGANHGIGAATAKALAAQGTAVLCAYFRNEDLGGLDDPSLPAAYRATRMTRAENVAESIRAAGGRAAAMEADLSDASSVPALFDAAEAQLGPVTIVVNNASGWIADTFIPAATDRFGRAQAPVSALTIDQVLGVDARAAALLIAEFARRHVARRGEWGRIIGLTSGDVDGFPEEVSYGAAKAAQVNFTLERGHRTGALRRDRQRGAPSDHGHRVDQPEDGRLGTVSGPTRRHAPPGGRRHRLSGFGRRGPHHGQRHPPSLTRGVSAGPEPHRRPARPTGAPVAPRRHRPPAASTPLRAGQHSFFRECVTSCSYPIYHYRYVSGREERSGPKRGPHQGVTDDTPT